MTVVCDQCGPIVWLEDVYKVADRRLYDIEVYECPGKLQKNDDRQGLLVAKTEIGDLLRSVVVEYLELIFCEIADRMAIAVGYDDIDINKVDVDGNRFDLRQVQLF